MDQKEIEKNIHLHSEIMDKKIIELFELNNVDERILTKEELKLLLPLIKTIVILQFSESVFSNLGDKLKK